MSEPIPSFSELLARQQLTEKQFDFLDQRRNLNIPGYFISKFNRVRILVNNSDAAMTRVVTRILFLLPNGAIDTIELNVLPTADRANTIATFNIGEGWIVSILVSAVDGAPTRGQTYYRLDIQDVRINNFMGQLLKGYVAQAGNMFWPNPLIEDSIEGRGALRSIAGTNPAAGVEISETVPANARWRLLGFIATLVADANAANRQVELIIDDGATNLIRIINNTVQTANQTMSYSAYINAQLISVAAVSQNAKLPLDLILPAGFRIRTVTNAILAGDDWGAPQLMVEEWFEQ